MNCLKKTIGFGEKIKKILKKDLQKKKLKVLNGQVAVRAQY